jgi:RND superfamily putative drug exporter
MKLLGEWNWYFPRWLEWLPRLDVEGAGAGVRGREALE